MMVQCRQRWNDFFFDLIDCCRECEFTTLPSLLFSLLHEKEFQAIHNVHSEEKDLELMLNF